ncbi:MAG TPA: serine hydrolase domain-containing protein [Candidatus Limnocylindrales bacterium]|nr:serine hydrolase domain-containing protein [Candidatus Limnocylindrales bacterium]
MALAVTAVFASPNRSPDSVAVAGATHAPTVAPSAEPGSPAAAGPTASPVEEPAAPTAAPAETVSPPSPAVVVVPAKRLQKAIDEFRAKTGIPGLSVAVVWDDGRSWVGASGRADVAARQPMTTETAFPFASVSKTLTAAVVLQLVDEGLVELDAGAATYLPAYHLDRRITVRMLLDHRSSLPDFFGNSKIDRALQRDKDATWPAARTWKYVPKVRPKPGTIYDYSNTNYLLLGELVEHVTTHPLATEIRTRLLDPLQLETAWYQGVEEPKAKGARGYRLFRTASGALLKPVAPPSEVMPFRSVVTAAGGAGSIAGTATDAARWMQAWGSGSVLSPATYREMLDDAKYTRAMHAIVTYGLGVQMVTIRGHQTLGHSGRYLGFQNTVRYLSGPGISIAILTNQNTYDPAVLMRRLVRIVAPVKPAG